MSPSLPVRIETERLVIKAPDAGDGVALAEAVAESFDALVPYLVWAERLQRFGPPNELSERAAELAERFENSTRPCFFVWEAREQRLLGELSLQTGDWEQGAVETAIWLRTSSHRQGFALEALAAVFEYLITMLEADLIEARINARNVASRELFTRLGMIRWGSTDDHDRYVLFPANWYAADVMRHPVRVHTKAGVLELRS